MGGHFGTSEGVTVAPPEGVKAAPSEGVTADLSRYSTSIARGGDFVKPRTSTSPQFFFKIPVRGYGAGESPWELVPRAKRALCSEERDLLGYVVGIVPLTD